VAGDQWSDMGKEHTQGHPDKTNLPNCPIAQLAKNYKLQMPGLETTVEPANLHEIGVRGSW